MLCPLLSRHQIDPATGQGEWIHQECLGARCKFYNIQDADCQFLLTSRNGNVTLPTAATAEALAGQGSAPAELAELVQAGLKTPLQDMRAAQEEAAARLRHLDEALASFGARDAERAEGAPEVSRQIEAALKKTLKSVQGAQESIDERLRRIEESLTSQGKDYERARSEIGDQVEAGLKKPLKNLTTAQEDAANRLARLEETLAAQKELEAASRSQAVSQFEGMQDSLKQVDERLKMLGGDQQEALRTAQAFRDTLDSLPSRQEAHAERLRAELEQALRGHSETLASRIGEEFGAHSREQLKNFEAVEENSVRHHGRLLQEMKKREETHQEALSSLRGQVEQTGAAVREATQRISETTSRQLTELRAALDASPAQFQSIAKQVKDLHQFTRDALDASRQRGEALWSQVETVGRSIGQLAPILKSLQGELERANSGISSVRGENKGVLLAFHEHKVAVQEEFRRKQAEQAREVNNKGVALYQRGSLEAAVEAFIRAVELRPDYAEAYNNLGLAYSKRGQSDEAVRYFQKALELDPQLGEVYNNLGFLFHTSARYDRAVEMFSRSLQAGADQSIAYTNLGNTFYKMKQNEKAVAAWKKALEIDPLSEGARRGLAMFQQEPVGAAPGRS